MLGPLVAGVPVADAFVDVSLGLSAGRTVGSSQGCSLGGSVRVSFVEPSVASSVSRVLVKHSSSASFGLFAN
jgi:hypothetical protein